MASPCELSPSEQQQIQQWIAAHGTPQQVALRCRIVLGCSQGLSDVAVAKQLSVNHKTVILWRKRFAQQRLDGLWEIAPGRGRKPRYDSDKIGAIVDATLQTKPKAMTPWSCRTMAKSQGVSKSTIHNIWQAHHLKPHRVKTFKPSRDPKFLEKLTDVVGLYLNPPQQAIVLCVDEKSQIQALDRTQPGLPLKKGRCGTMTPDYKRNGTTTLFAALETLQGKVIGQCYPRQRHQEFLKFLRRLDKEFPGDVPLHLVLDNYGTHKHEKVRSWFERHSRFELHFVPTSSSWLNLVERWFGELSEKAIRRGAFGSVEELKANSGEITAPCGVPTFAERFRQQLEQRLAEYELELSAEKTRLIEFGRYAAERRRRRGAGKPEGLDFLRFTHLCSRIWKSGGYTVKRKTVRKRMAAKLQAIGAQLRRRMHEPSVEQGRWLRRVLEGYYNYHAVPGNMRAMRSFQRQVARHWRQVLKRRSQRSCRRWEDFLPLLTQYVPWPSVRHPYPLDRFAATYPR